MCATLVHRGPDDEGTWAGSGVALGSRRLAVLDPTPRGHMPMASPNGRYHLVHNGEIFNYRRLRPELEGRGHRFTSDTDTEVLLSLFIERGPAMLAELNGQFAFAVWDEQERSLFLARDHVGIKPLFYVHEEGELRFASEEKALFAFGRSPEADPETLPELLQFRYLTGGRTPYRGVRQLAPGSCLTWRDGRIETRRWWCLAERLRDATANAPLSRAHSRGEYLELLDDAVALQRISDVPLGVLLSGGLDSSTLAAGLALQSDGPIDSFTVRFDDPRYDEGPFARAVADRYRLRPHEIRVSDEELPRLLEDATWLLGQPLAHGNDVHLLAIARHAKPRVTVLLSGEGADETLGGYTRYRAFVHPRLLSLLAAPLRLGARADVLPGRLRRAERLLRPAGIGGWLAWSAAAHAPGELPVPDILPLARERLLDEAATVYDQPVRQLMYLELHTYLQSILDRNDRMTMGASIECRVPFLDPRLIELAARVPTPWLLAGGRGKRLLREAMRPRLPQQVLAHRKVGFGVPWHHLLRRIEPLRAWLETSPRSSVVEMAGVPKGWARDVVSRFLAGDDRWTSTARQLAFVSLWYARCVERRTGILT